jgi:hypothetical protein
MSTLERPVDAALKTMLVNNEPFQYAHLIKFERPSRPDSLSGLVSTAAQRYTYLTDASINVDFDDGSKDLQGAANGIQTYLANKVLSVGAIQEQTKATTSNTSVVLDGNALGAYSKMEVTITGSGPWDIAVSAPYNTDDFLAAGFREGDKVLISYAHTYNNVTTNYSILVNIDSFRSNNILRVTKIDNDLTPTTYSSAPTLLTNCEFSLASEEVISILLNKNDTDYSSFINREVYIYRAYFQNGAIVGQPIPLFKGIIQNVSFEDSEASIRVTWGLGSHWGDFAQVKGRITSDSAHRALDANGVPQPQSALKPVYAYDKGFNHAELSINLLSKYVVMVPDIKVESKKGFLGIGASVKTKKQMVPEDRNTVLDFQLNAKAIPVIYGVRTAEGIPIFADTLNDDSSKVFVAVAISEGEIGGLYDLYIEGQSLICNDKADEDVRSASGRYTDVNGSTVTRTQDDQDSIQLTCIGRAIQGDVLKGTSAIVNTRRAFYDANGEGDSLNRDNFNFPREWFSFQYSPPIQISTSSTYGVLHGESITLGNPTSSATSTATSRHNFSLDLFTGKPGQKAATSLCDIAYAKNFRVQNNYWKGSNTSEYWGPNHTLSDTAYIVGNYSINAGETTIPEVKFVVRGKVVDCYNYDYSYSHDAKLTSESANNFVLGETVTLWRTDTNTQINVTDTVQIIDKWTLMNPDGTANIRFRFSVAPELVYVDGVPSIKSFYMKDASNNTWTMLTYNYNIFTGSVAGPISSPITGSSDSGDKLAFTYTSNSLMTIESDPINLTAQFQVLNSANYSPVTSGSLFPYAILVGTIAATNTTLVTGYNYADYSAEAAALSGVVLASKNTIRLSSGANGTDDYYKGYLLELTRYNSITGKSLVQTAEILGYNGANKIATIDTIWDFIPNTGDTVRIYPKYIDGRVSTNTTIQLLDYVTSTTYGRGLNVNKDLDLPSWLESARKCDTRSDITVLCSASPNIANGAVYKYPATGNIIWQGTANDPLDPVTVEGSTKYFASFTNNIGKLTNKWNSWKVWNVGEIIYNPDTYQFFTVGVNSGGGSGTIPIAPTATAAGTSTTPAVTLITSIPLTKVSGTGNTTVNLPATAASGNPIQVWKNGVKNSGYSLYDSDDINYWRLCGWDEHAQRYVTKNQSNLTIDTSVPLFDNINSFLEHFNGILRYTSGKYYLDVEEAEGTIDSTDIRTITTDDIIGKIQLSDEGTRSSFNSLTAAFADPANKFEPRNVSFFNSDYLKADKNVPKKGNLSIPGITNYYNTRLLADSFLNKSRFGLTISMTVRYHGILFLAGTVIQVIYPRYGGTWATGKKFRIESVNYQPDGLVDIVAKEYDDSFYGLTNIRKAAGSTSSATTGTGTPVGAIGVGSPLNLRVSSADSVTELLNGVELFWDNDPTVNKSSNAFTEVYGSISRNLYITVTSISSNTLTCSANHGLVPGMSVYFVNNYNTLLSSKTYYVLTTPTSTTFTLSDTKNGTALSPGNGSSLTVQIRTATLLATVPVPSRSYMDNLANEGTGRVEKYYWVRHKVNTA